jgi:hypothetical protein
MVDAAVSPIEALSYNLPPADAPAPDPPLVAPFAEQENFLEPEVESPLEVVPEPAPVPIPQIYTPPPVQQTYMPPPVIVPVPVSMPPPQPVVIQEARAPPVQLYAPQAVTFAATPEAIGPLRTYPWLTTEVVASLQSGQAPNWNDVQPYSRYLANSSSSSSLATANSAPKPNNRPASQQRQAPRTNAGYVEGRDDPRQQRRPSNKQMYY